MTHARRSRTLPTVAAVSLFLPILFSDKGFGDDATFRRGDSNVDGILSIGDPIHVATFLFLGGVEAQCKDASDVNDDGDLTISDVIHGVYFLFLGGEPPAAPWPQCGPDLSDDPLDCAAYDAATLCSQNQLPFASISADMTAGEAPFAVSLNAAGSSDPDGTIVAYSWDFGDGQTGAGAVTSHTFTDGGSFTVVLTVTDDEGATGTAQKTILVKGSASFAEEVHHLTNLYRVEQGLPPLKRHLLLEAAMQAHCQEMSDHAYFSHTSLDGRNAGQRMVDAGYHPSNWGENIAKGFPTPAAVVSGWIGSPGHRANMLNTSFRELGVGFVAAGRYWGQVFGVRAGIFPLVIDNEAPCTTSRAVELHIYGDGWAEEMQVSNDPEFSGASWQPYSSTLDWLLEGGSGTKTVYLRLRRGSEVKTAEDEIALFETVASS